MAVGVKRTAGDPEKTMSEGPVTKPCRMCLEPVRKGAWACPHCGWWQWTYRRLIPLGVIIICVLLLLLLLETRANEAIVSRAESVPYRDQIQVTGSTMLFGHSKDGPTVLVVGMLGNTSDVAWHNIGMEARFYGPDGRLIDVSVEHSYLTYLLPHGQIAFKLRAVADLPPEQYASYQVAVRSAESAY
jgi:hypothetical protein